VTRSPKRPGPNGANATGSGRSWRRRLDDPTEPLYTVGVVAELLQIDTQALRRLEFTLEQASARPSGNQRRYSRADIEVLAAAAELAADGLAPAAIIRILDLQQQLDSAAEET
jgi:DNA-binding transcriptional MerR regulator